jgi:hypothetical protein
VLTVRIGMPHPCNPGHLLLRGEMNHAVGTAARLGSRPLDGIRMTRRPLTTASHS